MKILVHMALSKSEVNKGNSMAPVPEEEVMEDMKTFLLSVFHFGTFVLKKALKQPPSQGCLCPVCECVCVSACVAWCDLTKLQL